MAIVGAGGARSAGEASRGGADLVQVRAKGLNSRDLATLVRSVIGEAGRADKVLVNSRPDIAELTGARGVHLPESGLDPLGVRRSFPRLLIGVSRHDRAGLLRARDEGADFALLGPVFGTPGKEGRALGMTGLEEMLKGVDLPVMVVGGITPENAPTVMGGGAWGVAAIRPFEDPRAASTWAEAFRQALTAGCEG